MRVDLFCLACSAEGLFTSIYVWEARRVYMQAAKLTLRKASAKLDTRVQSSTHARKVRAREALALARYLC